MLGQTRPLCRYRGGWGLFLQGFFCLLVGFGWCFVVEFFWFCFYKCGKQYCLLWGWWYRFHMALKVSCEQKGSWTYFVTLKILSSRRALNTLMPNEVPGFTAAQITSNILPTMTCKKSPFYIRQNSHLVLCGTAREAEERTRIRAWAVMVFLWSLQQNCELAKEH